MAREQLDDLMDTRAEIRRLRKQVADTKAAFVQAKADLMDKSALAEDILTQIEQHQGRLAFPDETPHAKAKRIPKRCKRDEGDDIKLRSEAG